MSTTWLSFGLFVLLPLFYAGAAPLELQRGEVVAFLGGEEMVRMQEDARLEASLTNHWREAAPKFRDLAWEGDTVYFQSTVRVRWRKEAFGGLDEQLKRVKATVVIAQFGRMEALDGVEKVDEFKKAYRELIDELSADGRRVVLLEPSSCPWPWTKQAAFPEYVQAIEAVAKEKGVPFVAGDKRHPVGAYIRGLTGADLVPVPDVLREAVREKHRLWVEYWRPSNWKCLFGDDSKRVFSNAAEGLPSFKEEWQTYEKLIGGAEERIVKREQWTPPEPPVRTGSSEADIKKELSAFEVLDGFEVSLFADEADGIANPLSIRWDASGRMYVACSDVYPQIEPGVLPNDKIIALRDTDGDGRADESKVFADGLNIPTGMEVGPDRVYVGQGTELLSLRDHNGDGVSDRRIRLLGGFGNGDSHQTSNSFVWSPGGELWFCQGDGIESRVETPFGVSSLFQAGVYRLRPGKMRLDGLLDDFMGPGNPWGVAFDDFGQSFVIDGAGGISHLTPASIPAKRRLKLPRIGSPGGYCGIECIGASAFPEEMQGEFVIGDYKKNQVTRFATKEDGAGFKVEFKKPLLRSKHRNFRPIDVKTGPDGAIYIVDWYNPITCHQDDFYRHPTRDKTHGRIWRVAPKGRALPAPKLVEARIVELIDALKSPERWTRIKAKQVLSLRNSSEVGLALREASRDWIGRNLMEAVAMLEWMDDPDAAMVEQLLEDEDPRARAYGARVVGRWGERLERAQELLLQAAGDPHPRVRMEAVLACAAIPRAESVLVAAAAVEMPRDRWIDYAFSQAVHHLKRHWLPAFRRGELDFGEYRGGLAAVLGAGEAKGVMKEIRELLRSGQAEEEERGALARTLVTLGDEDDLELVLGLEGPDAATLRALQSRDRPEFEVVRPLGLALDDPEAAVQAAAVQLVARWEVRQLGQRVSAIALDSKGPELLRNAAIRAMSRIGDETTFDLLMNLAGPADNPRPAAVAAMLDLDVDRAAVAGANMLRRASKLETIGEILQAFAEREGAASKLAEQLSKGELEPDRAELLRQAWVATGFVNAALGELLDELAGVKAGGIGFDEALVAMLAESGKRGDPRRGEALFHSAATGCAACHKVGERGGVIGPDLSAVGSGVPPERIVTEVLWPARQVKEGYALSRVTTKDGQVFQGYIQASRSKEKLLMRDFATDQDREVRHGEIAKKESIGSLMPPTAQSLTRAELENLFAYLFGLSGAP